MSTPAPQVNVLPAPFYRDRTLAVLRRYFRLTVETGRLPSCISLRTTLSIAAI